MQQISVLIVSATAKEISAINSYLKATFLLQEGFYLLGNCRVKLLVTGVGMLSTAFFLGQEDLSQYNWVINVGIAGAFDKHLELGQLAEVVEEEVEGFGIRTAQGFESMFTTPFFSADGFPYKNGKLKRKNLHEPLAELTGLVRVRGLTSNTVHGEAQAIASVMSTYHAHVETMESAAFFYACLMKKCTNILALRGISNYVEPRNRDNWKVDSAIGSVNNKIIELLRKWSVSTTSDK